MKIACPVILDDVSGSESEAVWNVVGGKKRKNKLRRPCVKVRYHGGKEEPTARNESVRIQDHPGERRVNWGSVTIIGGGTRKMCDFPQPRFGDAPATRVAIGFGPGSPY